MRRRTRRATTLPNGSPDKTKGRALRPFLFGEDEIVMADPPPRCGRKPAGRRGRAQEFPERGLGPEREHGALAVARDRGELVHDVAHAHLARGGEEDREV